MGQKKRVIFKKVSLLAVFSVFVFMSCGCNTVSCASKGAAEGAKKDYEEAKKADDWMRRNLW